MECVRCQTAEADDGEYFCSFCRIKTKVEFVKGFRELREYLAGWTEFEEWCRGHNRPSPHGT